MRRNCYYSSNNTVFQTRKSHLACIPSRSKGMLSTRRPVRNFLFSCNDATVDQRSPQLVDGRTGAVRQLESVSTTRAFVDTC